MNTVNLKSNIYIDFLYRDLTICSRCQNSDYNLDEGINIIKKKFPEKNIYLNKVNVETKALANQYSFMTSPTIRVNGMAIEQEIKEDDCMTCGDLSGGQVDCRLWTYKGLEYHAPPVDMLVDAIGKIIAEESWKKADSKKRLIT